MATNTPSSLICFKNGYSYVNIPVTLTFDQQISDSFWPNIRECQVGPLPNFAVHGTVALAPHNPESVKIFSLSQAAKKIIKPLLLKIPKNHEENDFSYEKFLTENIGTAVSLTCLIQTGTGESIAVARERTFNGIIKAIHKDFRGKGESLVVLRSVERNGGEKLIKCSSIVFLETIQITDPYVEGIFELV